MMILLAQTGNAIFNLTPDNFSLCAGSRSLFSFAHGFESFGWQTGSDKSAD